MGFQWITPPSVLARRIEEYGRRVLVAVHTAAARWGQEVQDQGRRSAPWEDRSGNARSGLFFAVDGFGLSPIVGEVDPRALVDKTDVAMVQGDDQTLIVTFGHTVFYGKFLELSHGGQYAIVMSTMLGNLPQLERMLKDLLR